MNLFYVILNHHDFAVNSRIYAEIPWTLESDVKIIAAEAEQAPFPDDQQHRVCVFLRNCIDSQIIQHLSKPESMHARQRATNDRIRPQVV